MGRPHRGGPPAQPVLRRQRAGLYDLARPREGSLYAALNRHGAERAEWTDALKFLSWAREEGRGHGPFDFLSHMLSRLDTEGRSQRQRLITRLGEEAGDAAEALLAEALAAEAAGITDLERFAVRLERAEIEVKREMEAASGQVRVMTVHGAKGLEAPIVFLPDAATPPRPARGGLLRTEEGGFLFAPRSAEDSPASAAARERARAAGEAESLRLLYVAMTRARDRLIVAGRLGVRETEPHAESWYARLAHALDDPTIAPEVTELEDGDLALRRYGPGPRLRPGRRPGKRRAGRGPRLDPPIRPARSGPGRICQPLDVCGAPAWRGAVSPLAAVGTLGRFRRGELIHKLLQRLPDLPHAERTAHALRLPRPRARSLPRTAPRDGHGRPRRAGGSSLRSRLG